MTRHRDCASAILLLCCLLFMSCGKRPAKTVERKTGKPHPEILQIPIEVGGSGGILHGRYEPQTAPM